MTTARTKFLIGGALVLGTAGYLMATGAMLALKRRAEIGGSWLVRLSLAQVGHWLTGLGRLPDGRSAATITRADVPHLLHELPSRYGKLSQRNG